MAQPQPRQPEHEQFTGIKPDPCPGHELDLHNPAELDAYWDDPRWDDPENDALTEYHVWRHTLNELRTEFMGQLDDVCELGKENRDLKNEVTHLETEVTCLENDVQYFENEVIGFEYEVQNLENEIRVLKDGYKVLEDEYKELEVENDEYDDTYIDNIQMIGRLETENRDLKEEVERLRATIVNMTLDRHGPPPSCGE